MVNYYVSQLFILKKAYSEILIKHQNDIYGKLQIWIAIN
jgi:hypothetical protein